MATKKTSSKRQSGSKRSSQRASGSKAKAGPKAKKSTAPKAPPKPKVDPASEARRVKALVDELKDSPAPEREAELRSLIDASTAPILSHHELQRL